jgi:hypothetical protein
VLEALGNLGDFVGGLAVIVTLAYLAVQVRQNTRQLERTAAISKAAAYQNLTTLIVEGNARISTNREFAELRMRGRQALSNLDEVDQNRFLVSMSSVFRIMENLHQQNAASLLSDDEYSSWQHMLRMHLSYPGAREAWRQIAPAFSPGFRDVVEGILREPAA